jgi:hypothetical protein
MSLPRRFHFDLAQTGLAWLSRGIRPQLRRIKSPWSGKVGSSALLDWALSPDARNV